MKLRLLEIELYSKDPERAKEFYRDQLGLDLGIDKDGLKVFNPGIPGVDFDKSTHFPGRVSISFFTENVPECMETLTARGATILERYGNPVSAIVLKDPDGCRIEIKSEVG